MAEFNSIVSMLNDHVEQSDERSFMRLNYWLRQPDLDAQIVCGNVEFVRFGLMAARPVQGKKKLGSTEGAEFCETCREWEEKLRSINGPEFCETC